MIELRTPLDALVTQAGLLCIKNLPDVYVTEHDAIAAHAYKAAIAECRQTRTADGCEEDWIEQRASALLQAWLEGEKK